MTAPYKDVLVSKLAPDTQTSTASGTTKRRPGRRFKKPTSSRSSRSRSGPYDRPSNSPATTIPQSPTRTLSILEALPVEVIEHIFLYSLELNFPRASPFLSRALSREHIYRALILLAFWDDPPSYPRSKAIDRLMVPLQYDPLSLDERTILQESVFKCKWCTVDRVREQVPVMQTLTINRHWINAGIVTKANQQADFEKFLSRKDDSVRIFFGTGKPMRRLRGFLKEQTGPRFSQLAPHEDEGIQDYELHVMPMVNTEIRCPSLNSLINFPALELRSFPPHLLRGRSNGFSSDDSAFLEMLRITSCNWTSGKTSVMPQTLTLVDRGALHEGVDNAIRHQNFSALVTLLKIDEYTFRYKAGTHGRTFYTIPSGHFVTVTRYGRDDPSLNVAFMNALVRANAESLPHNSPEITQWIIDQVDLAQRNPSRYRSCGNFARWLSHYLIRMPRMLGDIQVNMENPLFVHGQLNPTDYEGSLYKDQVIGSGEGAAEIPGNWFPESSFLRDHYWMKKFGPFPP
ncbi:hypothetical protein N7467_004350 [Penicillium canescens]|nr:hypothetical protein N7467_004350 [Penicillium canescens]